MADLDDFFAKKDRMKMKSAKKFATADELAKKFEDTKQKSDVRPKKERPVQEGEEGARRAEEEEWKEYEEPVKDYSGLKIQVLQGGNGTTESGRDPMSEDSAPDNGKSKGPWNKPVESVPEPVVKKPDPPEPVVRQSVYVPPTNRNRPVEPRARVQNKNAPDIHNDDNFPVLGAVGGGRAGGWSMAAAAGGARPAPTHARQALALDNRFTELQDDS